MSDDQKRQVKSIDISNYILHHQQKSINFLFSDIVDKNSKIKNMEFAFKKYPIKYISEESPRGVVVNVLNWNIVVSDLELQLLHFHFD